MIARLDKNKIRLLAFDIDGTLFSSEDIILDTYRLAFAEYKTESGKNIPLPSQAALMAQIGKPVKTIFQNLVPDLPESEREILSEKILNILCRRILAGEGHPYPDVESTIRSLKEKKYLITAASNGRYPYIDSILTRLNVKDYFDEIIALDYKERKVKADLLLYYKTKYNLQSDEILMIGDRFSDYEAAAREETPFLFCSFGHADPGEILEFSKEISKLREMLEIF